MFTASCGRPQLGRWRPALIWSASPPQCCKA